MVRKCSGLVMKIVNVFWGYYAPSIESLTYNLLFKSSKYFTVMCRRKRLGLFIVGSLAAGTLPGTCRCSRIVVG